MSARRTGGAARGHRTPPVEPNTLDKLMTDSRSASKFLRSVPDIILKPEEQALWLNPRLTNSKDDYLCNVGGNIALLKSTLRKILSDDGNVDTVLNNIKAYSVNPQTTQPTPTTFLEYNIVCYCAGFVVQRLNPSTCITGYNNDADDIQFTEDFAKTWASNANIRDVILMGDNDIIFRISSYWTSQSVNRTLANTQDFQCSEVLVVYKVFSESYLRFSPLPQMGIASTLASGTPFVSTKLDTPSLSMLIKANDPHVFINTDQATEFVNHLSRLSRTDKIETNTWYTYGSKYGIFLRMKTFNSTNTKDPTYLDHIRTQYRVLFRAMVQFINRKYPVAVHNDQFPPLPYTCVRVNEQLGDDITRVRTKSTIVLWVIDSVPKYKTHRVGARRPKFVCDASIDGAQQVESMFKTLAPGSIEAIRSVKLDMFGVENEEVELTSMRVGNTPIPIQPPSPTAEDIEPPPPPPQQVEEEESMNIPMRVSDDMIRDSEHYTTYNKPDGNIDACGEANTTIIDPCALFNIYFRLKYHIDYYGQQVTTTDKTGKQTHTWIKDSELDYVNGAKGKMGKMEALQKDVENTVSGKPMQEHTMNVFANGVKYIPATRGELNREVQLRKLLNPSNSSWTGMTNTIKRSGMILLSIVQFVLSRIFKCNMFLYIPTANIQYINENGDRLDTSQHETLDKTIGDLLIISKRDPTYTQEAHIRFLLEESNWTVKLCKFINKNRRLFDEKCPAKPPTVLYTDSITVKDVCGLFAHILKMQSVTIRVDGKPFLPTQNQLYNHLVRSYQVMFSPVTDKFTVRYSYETELEHDPALSNNSNVCALTNGVFYLYQNGPIEYNKQYLAEAKDKRRQLNRTPNLGGNVLMTDLIMLADMININLCVSATFKREGYGTETYNEMIRVDPTSSANVKLEFQSGHENPMIEISDDGVTYPITKLKVIGYHDNTKEIGWKTRARVLKDNFVSNYTHKKALTYSSGMTMSLIPTVLSQCDYISDITNISALVSIAPYILGAVTLCKLYGLRHMYSEYEHKDLLKEVLREEDLYKTRVRNMFRQAMYEANKAGEEIDLNEIYDEIKKVNAQYDREYAEAQGKIDLKELNQKSAAYLKELAAKTDAKIRIEDLKGRSDTPSESMCARMCSCLTCQGIPAKYVFGAGVVTFIVGGLTYNWESISTQIKEWMTLENIGLLAAGVLVLMILAYKTYTWLYSESSKPDDKTSKPEKVSNIITAIDTALDDTSLGDDKINNLRNLRNILLFSEGKPYFIRPGLKSDDITAYVDPKVNDGKAKVFGNVKLGP